MWFCYHESHFCFVRYLRGLSNRSDAKGKVTEKAIRFTVDLDADQYTFLKKYSEDHGITSSITLRALLYILEIDESFANRVIEVMFPDGKDDAKDDDSEEKTES